MSLTMGSGPLVAKEPPESNYEIDGPKHRILWGDFPRRVRGELAGATVLDTTRGRLLHESQMLPVLYVPEADVATDLLEPTDHHTICPFKGEASYWSVRVGNRVAENAAWAYPEPIDEAPWLAGHLAFYWKQLDAWYDEGEQVFGHLRDPFHRVDVRPSSRPVTVNAGGEAVGRSAEAMVLSETGLPNRIYLPHADVREGLLEPTATTAVCPYKGEASYWSLSVGGRTLEDAAFAYGEPLDGARRVAGFVCFLHEDVETTFAE